MLMHEIEGRCPLCDTAMQDCARNLICDYKRYNFPYRFYFCHWHGIYVWRRKKHELFDLPKRMNQAISIEPLEPEVIKRFTNSGSHMPTLSDYKPVMLKCPYCNLKWRQYDPKFLRLDSVFCPFCHVEITKEKVMEKLKSERDSSSSKVPELPRRKRFYLLTQEDPIR
ncbi:MAG: hypothetical protein QXY74_08140 [Candidatus Bathyarchaeia archaeon]